MMIDKKLQQALKGVQNNLSSFKDFSGIKKPVVNYWVPLSSQGSDLTNKVNDFWVSFGENYDKKSSNWTGD